MIDKLNTKKDIILLFVISLILWLFLSSIDGFELLMEYLESHEKYELDELLLLIIIIGILSIFYSFFKIKESNKINKQLENINKELERKVEKEIKRRQVNESLIFQQAKFSSMGEMIGNIAHQWRQPLNALGLVIQNINFSHEIGELDDKLINSSMKKATNLTNNMSKTIDDFRSFYKLNKEKKYFLIDNSINKTLSLVEATFEDHNIKINFKNEIEIKVFGFENEFTQSLLNILNNAKDALVEKKIVNSRVNIELNEDNKYGYVIIKDNAGGIPEHCINNIFDPYFTTKEEGKGTGIGLYMSKIIIEQNMHGKLEVENVIDGAKFIIKIPINDKEEK